jgi:hypothetical protein
MIYTILSLCLTLVSCNSNDRKSDFKCLMPYAKQQMLVNYNGYSVKPYFPINTFLDSLEIVNSTTKRKEYLVQIDSFSLAWYSFDLTTMNEPILCNEYLGKEIYRFSCFPAFNPPVTITLEKEGDSIYLTTKKTNKIPQLPFIHVFENGKEIKRQDSIYLAINDKRILKQEDYQKFRDLLNTTRISCLSPKGITQLGVDGSEWIFEIHNENGYYYNIRWTPDKNTAIKQIGEFLIGLSAAKKERRY